jgi:hypothetical protein
VAEACLHVVWPRLEPPEDLNPARIFARYQQALDRLNLDQASTLDGRLLDLAQKLFDEASSRRTSIDSGAVAILPVTGIVVSLIVSVGFGSLKDITASADFDRIAIYVVFTISLVFLGRAIFYAIRVGTDEIFRNTLGPDDISPPPPAARNGPSRYDRHIARKLIEYTTANYKINNTQRARLRLAQVSLRNGIMIIIGGGIIVATYSLLSLLLQQSTGGMRGV